MPTLTINYIMAMRQQMDESNHDNINTLTLQMGTIFNPLIQNINQSYHQLATQMTRIDDFFGAPPMQVRPVVQRQVVRQVRNEGFVLEENTVNHVQKSVAPIGRTRDTYRGRVSTCCDC